MAVVTGRAVTARTSAADRAEIFDARDNLVERGRRMRSRLNKRDCAAAASAGSAGRTASQTSALSSFPADDDRKLRLQVSSTVHYSSIHNADSAFH